MRQNSLYGHPYLIATGLKCNLQVDEAIWIWICDLQQGRASRRRNNFLSGGPFTKLRRRHVEQPEYSQRKNGHEVMLELDLDCDLHENMKPT